MDSRRLIARNLKRLRLFRQLLQEALALDADVDRSYVSGLERGVRNPSVDILDRLAEALAANTAEFFAADVIGSRPRGLPRGRRTKERK